MIIEHSSITKLDQATRMLAEIRTIDDAKNLINLAEAARVYARQVELGLEAQNHAAEIKLRAQRKAGEILVGMEKAKGQLKQGPQLQPVTAEEPPTYADMGIDKVDAHRWQQITRLPEKVFENYIQQKKDNEQELTTAGILRESQKPHVSFNSGNNEWYTPPEYIEAARNVLGTIDLDPASSELANKIVKATVYFTAKDNGLKYSWDGRVWMNPPYSGDLIGKFTNKLVEHFVAGDISEAIVLVNNATETAWFQKMLECVRAICFLNHRIKYLDATGVQANAPLQGQAILYFGKNVSSFLDIFSCFGKVLYA